MKCKECVHCDICLAVAQSKERGERKHAIQPNECRFKDKSRFAEMPCNHNDTLYHYKTVCKKLGRKKAEETIIEPISIDRFIIGELGVPQAECCNDDNEWVTYGADDFGKVVFLTREDAEKALEAQDETQKR